MQIIREVNEFEMILHFLKCELNSTRFNQKLLNIMDSLSIKKELITKANLNSKEENELRLALLNKYRGYPNKEMFKNFPKKVKWYFVKFTSKDINTIYYIDYDYWNELSNNTSSPIEAALNIKKGIEIYGVSNTQFLNGEKYLDKKSFLPIILLTIDGKKNLIIEGHSRMTIYGLNPSKFKNTYGYLGYCSKEEMLKYDKRMIE